jgi:hypothetical protein
MDATAVPGHRSAPAVWSARRKSPGIYGSYQPPLPLHQHQQFTKRKLGAGNWKLIS